jgi:hypothetical protein
MQQDYKHHIRYYPPHHFIFYPVSIGALGLCAWYAVTVDSQNLLWWAVTGTIGLIIWVSYMLRQHYALTVQNRIVRTELRFRFYVLTHERLENYESGLSLSQIFALRFASDEELPALVQRAVREKLSPDAIKQAIHVWQPDHMRV